ICHGRMRFISISGESRYCGFAKIPKSQERARQDMNRLLATLPAIAASFFVGCNRDVKAPDVRLPDVQVNEQEVVPVESGIPYCGSLEPLIAYRGKELAKLD